jgi:hypothetical protein
MSVVVNVFEHDDLAYDYQICEDDDGTFYVWTTTGVLRGRKDVEGIETIEEAVKSLLEVMTRREGWK